MNKIEFGIYVVHAAFWGAFWVTVMVLRRLDSKEPVSSDPAPRAKEEKTAPYSRAVMAFHVVAFFTMYFGIARAVLKTGVPAGFPGQRVIGFLVIASGSALMIWARVHFRSWRFRAKLETGHELVTSGPFRLMRHPIYMGMNLLALGTAIWIPTMIVWTGFVLVVAGGDLRARVEEPLLTNAFGTVYRDYCLRTRRFVPGIY